MRGTQRRVKTYDDDTTASRCLLPHILWWSIGLSDPAEIDAATRYAKAQIAEVIRNCDLPLTMGELEGEVHHFINGYRMALADNNVHRPELPWRSGT